MPNLQRTILLTTAAFFVLGTAPTLAAVCVNPAKAGCAATIQAGVDLAVAGDTVKIAKGTYNENVVIPSGKDGLKLTGPKKGVAILDADDPNVGTAIEVNSDGVTITRITLRNGQSEGIDLVGVNNTTLSDVSILGPDGNCVGGDGNGTTITDCTLMACGNNGVELSGNQIVIEDTTVRNTALGGIVVTGENTVVERNSVSVSLDDDCIGISGNGADVVKNTLTTCNDGGIDVSGDDVLVKSNTVSHQGGTAIEVFGDTAVVTRNKVFSADSGVEVFGANPQVTKNAVEGSRSTGMEVFCNLSCTTAQVKANTISDVFGDGSGLVLNSSSTGMVALQNSVTRAQDNAVEISGIGITATDNRATNSGADPSDECFDVEGTSHVLQTNTASGCTGDGFNLDGNNHVLSENTAKKNNEDGFDVIAGASTITLSGNDAKKNTGIGIEVSSTAVNTSVQNNKAKGNFADFCDEGTATVQAGNTFGTTAITCAIGN